MTPRHLGLGQCPDACWHAGRWVVAWQHGEELFLEFLEPDSLREVSFTSISLGPGAGAFARLRSWLGRLWITYREGEPHERLWLREIGTSSQENLGRAHGNDPAAFGEGVLAWQTTGAPEYRVVGRSLDGAPRVIHPRLGAPTGLSRVTPDGSVRLVDEDRKEVTGFTRPAWAGDLVTVEYHRSGNRGVLARLTDGRELVLWETAESLTPRCATDGGDRFLVVTWGEGTVRAIQVSRDEFQQPQPAPEPVLDTSGQAINLWAYLLPEAGMFPRTSHRADGHGHEMHCLFDGRNLWTLPFGEPDHWVRMVVEHDTLTFREDRSRDGQSTGDYSFTHGPWLRRVMRPGEVIVNAQNSLVRYQPDGCQVVDVHAFPFRVSLHQHWLAFDCGGDLGWRKVAVVNYDPGSDRDTYELSYFAEGAGLFRWEEYDQKTHALRHWTEFNVFGGRAPQPTQGCWRREHLSLTPENWKDEPASPVDPVDPVDPVEPRTMVSFKTVSGHYLCAEEGGGREINATRTAPGPWETFEVIPYEGGIALKASNGQYVCAENGGGSALNANRNSPGPWERFTVVRVDGGIALQSIDGFFVCAEGGGGGAVNVTRTAAGAWETFDAPALSGTHGGGGNGHVSLGGQAQADPRGGFMVNGVPTLIQGVHDGSGLSQFFYNPDECRRRDQLSAQAGFHFRRAWWDVDGPYWEGQAIQPHWPTGNRVLHPHRYGVDAYIAQCVEYLKHGERLGIGAHMARGTWTSTGRHEMAAIVHTIVESAGAHTIVIGEAVNESDAVTPHTPVEHLTEFRERAYPGVALRCNSAIGGMDFTATMVNGERLRRVNPGASIIPFHGYRGGGWQNKLERDWNVRYEWGIEHAVSGEPMGVGHFVSAHDNIHELNSAFFQIYTALMFACGYIPVFMSSPGVIPDEHRSEPWGSSPGFWDVCKVREWLPADAGHFRRVYHGGDRWGNERYFRAIGDTRVEHHIEPETQRGIIIAYGDDAAHIPMHRKFNIENDVWIEEGHIRGRLIVGRA